MRRALWIIAGASALVCGLAVAGAFALGGGDALRLGGWTVAREGVRWTWVSERARHRRHRSVVDGSGPEITREIPWADYEILALDVPADVTFIQSTGPAMVRATGPSGTVNQLVLHSGLLHFRDHVKNGGRLRIVVTAPGIERFELSGSNSLTIQNYHRERMQLDATGGAQVRAQGETGVIVLYVSGAAQADMKALKADGVDVEARGNGETTVTPAHWAHVVASDHGVVRLTREPASVESDISDAGQILRPE
jgi:hypothetical protein